MIKPLIYMKPTNAWNNLCKDCHKLIKTTGFIITLSDAWDATPDDKFYLCSKCAKKAYPYYFLTEKEKRKFDEQSRNGATAPT